MDLTPGGAVRMVVHWDYGRDYDITIPFEVDITDKVTMEDALEEAYKHITTLLGVA